MKCTDNELQAAIDAALIATEATSQTFTTCPETYPKSWAKESPARLALAKAFLAKLPAGLQASEADKALANLASRLANIAYDPVQPMAFAKSVADHVDDLREDINHAQKVSLADASATDATIARLNAELAALRQPILADDGRSLGQVLYEAGAAVANNTPGQPPCDQWSESEDCHEAAEAAAQAVACVVLAKAIRRMEAVPVKDLLNILAEARGDGLYSLDRVRARLIASARGEALGINGLTETEEAQTASVSGLSKPNSTDWKARADKAEAELAALKSSPIGNLRPLSEAADPYARLKAYAKAGARIRFEDSSGWGEWAADEDWGWCFPPENYQVHPDDLRMVPEYAPVTIATLARGQVDLTPELQTIVDAVLRDEVNSSESEPVTEQPKQQVPLGLEDVPPGSVFQCADREYEGWPATGYHTPICVHYSGVLLINSYGNQLKITWPMLKNHWFVNTSIPLTGKWDANAWQSCHKLI